MDIISSDVDNELNFSNNLNDNLRNNQAFWKKQVEKELNITVPLELYSTDWCLLWVTLHDLSNTDIKISAGIDHLLCSKHANFVSIAILAGADPSVAGNYPIKYVSRKGYLETAKRLLQDTRVNPSVDNNYAFIKACRKQHIDVINLLLQDTRVSPNNLDNYAIRYASRCGCVDVVKVLLKDKRVNPAADDNCAIKWAAKCGNPETVNLLLTDPRVDPSTDNNCAVKDSFNNGCLYTASILLNDPRVKNSLGPDLYLTMMSQLKNDSSYKISLL